MGSKKKIGGEIPGGKGVHFKTEMPQGGWTRIKNLTLFRQTKDGKNDVYTTKEEKRKGEHPPYRKVYSANEKIEIVNARKKAVKDWEEIWEKGKKEKLMREDILPKVVEKFVGEIYVDNLDMNGELGDRIYAQTIAEKFMEKALKIHNLDYAKGAVELYEKTGTRMPGAKDYLEQVKSQDIAHRKSPKNLLNKLELIIPIIFFAGTLFFLSSKITGYSVAGINSSSSTIIGGLLFVVGIVAFLFYRGRRKINNS